MTNRPQYGYMLDTDCIRFVDKHIDGEYGYVKMRERPYPVRFPDGELIGTVTSLCDALPLILERGEELYAEHRRRLLEREKAVLKPGTVWSEEISRRLQAPGYLQACIESVLAEAGQPTGTVRSPRTS
jgi:hypothetical protein